MAAEPTRIKLKRSTTATVVPTTSNLADGEVAVNIADRKIYVRNGGSIVEVANQKPNTGEVTTAMLATDITNGPGNTYYVATTGSNANTLGSGGANGKHPDAPFLTVAKALSVATSGDTVNIAAGTYQEVFPLTVPDGVTVRGANLRATQITPTPSTNDLNAFILEGDCHVSDLTVKDFFYNSGNDTGYGFACASGLDSDRSPYIERVTVLTKGSVTSGSDPYGFAQGDAGRGAKIDGSLFSSNAIESAVLFNEVTFIVPNSVGLYGTNGARVEWLNSFVYFAAEGIKGVQGATGRAGAGQTRLKLAGVSGSFGAAETIYQLADSFQSGTYSRTGTTVTITKNSHGCQNGDVIYADFISGAGTDGYYTVANVAANTFDITDTASGTTSGNVTYKKADAYGLIDSNDGTYLYINGKGTGEFTIGVPTGKVGVIAGDAQLDTAQQKFGTASLLLDGVTDHLSFPTDEDFGFGTTNFAIECFIRPTAVTGTQYFLDFRDGSASDTAPVLYLDGSTLHFAVGNTSQISGGTLSAGTWYHVAAARSGGTTKLFLDGTEIGTYSDSNDYGATKPLGVGGEYAGTNEFGGHIDEIRVSKAAARYTAAFTAPTAAFTTDLYTVLLLHFDGTDGSTTITDSGKGVKDIRSDGGDSATSLLTTDYSQFGLELRSISSANIYGTKGAVADGAGVKLLLTSHNFAYIGSGADFTNDPDLAVPANEVTELNGGRVFYSATNEKGDFRIGDAFVVDQQTGNVAFQSTSTSQEAANITLSDGTGTTRIFPAFIETGNLRLSGNTISSTSGSIIVDPSSNEDITLNAEVIANEELFFDNAKTVGIKSANAGNASLQVNSKEQGGWSSYGLYTTKNVTVNSKGLATVSIDTEGDGYTAGNYNLDVVTSPPDLATATATLDTTNGSVKTLTLTNAGSLYTVPPDISFTAPGGLGLAPSASVQLKTYGVLARVDILPGGGGSGYTSPTLTVDDPSSYFFSTLSVGSVAANSIAIPSLIFEDDTQILYDNEGGSENIGLVSGNLYWVINADYDSNTFQLSNSQGGSAIALTAGTAETHSFRGQTATATATVTAGEITAVTVTSGGSYYTSSPAISIADSGTPTAASLTPFVGYEIDTITLSGKGTGYTSTPTVSITPDSGDTTGSGGTAIATIGFPLSSITLTSTGSGYSFAPIVQLSGGTPDTEATVESALNKRTGKVASITVTGQGLNYSTAPTVTLVGGSSKDAVIQASFLPFGGTIGSGGSGYVPGTYSGVTLTGGSQSGADGFVAATANILVRGLIGSITGGSGYTNGEYTTVPLKNDVTSTLTIAAATREIILIKYDASDDYEWNVVDDGSNTAFDFTRVSATGTASGSNISITAERGDILTFNINAPGHPFYIQKTSGSYDAAQLINLDISSNGTSAGTVVWDTRQVEPGTYYYVCGNHAIMAGTITISAFSGTEYAVSDTITAPGSGASGVVTSITDYAIRFATVSGGPFVEGEAITNGSVTAVTTNPQLSSQTVYSVNGVEGGTATLLTHNTYRFDTSSSTLSTFTVNGGTGIGLNSQSFGSIGTSGSYTQFVITDQADTSSQVVSVGFYPTTGNYLTIADGSASQGTYGLNATADITVTGGAVTAFTFDSQGTGYKVGDTVTADASDLGGTGAGFSYNLTTNDTSIFSVTQISASGGPYVSGDTLSVDPTFDGTGSGGGFQFNVTKGGYLGSVTVSDAGFGYEVGETLLVTSDNPPTTAGTAFDISVGTITEITPIEIQYDGGITSANWSILEDGTADFGSGGVTIGGPLTTNGGITNTGNISSTSISTTAGGTIGGTLTVTGNLTANGSSNTINNSSVSILNGTAAAPSLKLVNSTTTGLYRDAADVLGITAGGTARVKIGTAAIETTNDIKADSAFGAITPFFFVNTTGESVDIGAPETGLRINNDASIEAIGADTNVDITFVPKGTGNLIFTGGTDKDFSITDGSTETFKVDTDTGNTTISGRLDVSSSIRLDDNIISNNSTTATSSFGQIVTISATGTGTGFTDNTYIGVTSTSDRSGTGATFDVTVSGGDITAIAVNASGAGYTEGEEITLNPATVGAGTGKTITVTDIEGAGLVLKPQNGKNVKVDSTAMFVVPAGDTNQRPASGDRQIGGIRFNTQQQQFEGYNGTDFVSLGGVRDVNQDTYILTELSPGSNEDTFFFYNQGVNSLDIVQDKFKLYTAKTFDTSGTLTLNGVTIGSDSLDVQTLGTSIVKVRSQKDLEVTGGLRFKSVPVLGEVATLGSITSGTGVYTPSTTFNGVTSSSQFEGGGATFDVVVDGSGSIQSISLATAGSGYEVAEIITISGADLGGATPANDVTFPIATLANTTGTFARLDILQQDYVTQLDNKPFLSLDANGAQAAWKINRGWNAGTESYLTVMDSTADFVELDDCRVEGGQLTSFTASSTLVQFDKTAYKGAKTLVTIESDDGKVHMLEVTSVCAAAGTNAYATVTNSVTSDNDLVDASIAVVGNNVQVTVTKSSAATSSTTFTGRFTTTKVKV